MDRPRREPMSTVDAAWLGMDQPTNLMIINGVMLFDQRIEFDRLQQVLETRLAGPYVRFRQRIVESPPATGRFFWELDPHYDIRAHVHRIALPAPGTTGVLQSVVGDLMSESLDRRRPLWRFYLIENFGEGCAVFGRIHHCIADGIALVRVLLSMTDLDPDGATAGADGGVAEKRAAQESRPFDLVGDAIVRASELTASALEFGLRSVREPGSLVEQLATAGLFTATCGAILGKLLVMPADRESAYRGPLGVVKRVAWSEPIELEQVKQIGKAMGATINDVLVAAVTGALRLHMIRRHDRVDGEDIRAMVPINLRPLDAELSLGNQFSLVYLALPVTVADPLARLYEVKRRMDFLKRSPEPMLVYQVLSLLGMAPGEVANVATDWFAGKASCVLTNVPGPRQTLYFAGCPLRRLLFWVPQSGGIGMGISIISYDGSVSVGIMADASIVSEPEGIVTAFQEEFQTLRGLAQAQTKETSGSG